MTRLHLTSCERADVDAPVRDAATAAPWEAQPYISDEAGCSIVAVIPGQYTPTRGMVAWLTTGIGAASGSQATCEANAALIVRAVNAHEALVAALRALLCEAGYLCDQLAARGLPGCKGDTVDRAMDAARAALALAEGSAP